MFLLLIFMLISLVAFNYYADYQSHKKIFFKHNTLDTGRENLKKIIQYQDWNYQNINSYASFSPEKDLKAEIDNFKICNSDCTPCEYATTTKGSSFTSTAKCTGKDGQPNYIGYVRVAIGEHEGIDGYFKKCTSKGIYAGSRNLINTVGPCFEQTNSSFFVASGSKKRLVVQTFPADAKITVNGQHIGATSSNHNTFSQSYGSYFWLNPFQEAAIITITKPGYKTIRFPLEWGSYTYTAAVVLTEIYE